MKKSVGFGILLFALVFLISFVSSAIPSDCPSTMISYWKFDSNAEDSYSNNEGTWSGTGIYIPMKIDEGASFDGASKISVSSSDKLNLVDSWSMFFWIRQGGSLDAKIIDKGNYKVEFVRFPSPILKVTVMGSSITSGMIVPDTNYFISVVRDEVAQNLTLYVNGVKVNETKLIEVVTPTTNPLVFGEDFLGYLDEVAFYDLAFDNASVLRYYTSSNAGSDYCYYAGGGETSSTRADYTVPGCMFSDGVFLPAGQCSLDGMRYCSDTLVSYWTLTDHLGCSYGTLPLPDGNTWGCCPGGYYCDDSDSENVVCELSSWTCSDFLTFGTCETTEHKGCKWVGKRETPDDTEGICVSNLDGFSCGSYPESTSCEEDFWNLAVTGVGTESCDIGGQKECGITFSSQGCYCYWDTDNDGECRLLNNFTEDYTFTPPKSWSCNSDINIGDCVDGQQPVNILSEVVSAEGDLDDVVSRLNSDGASPPWTKGSLIGCIKTNICNSGDTTRYCGDDIIKLPGFSLFAFIGAVGILVFYYLFKRD